MTDFTEHRRQITDAQQAYVAASDERANARRIDDTLNEWVASRRAAKRWVADSDIAAERAAMVEQANQAQQEAARRLTETLTVGAMALQAAERADERIVPLWQQSTARNAGDYVTALVRLSWEAAVRTAAERFAEASWSEVETAFEVAVEGEDWPVLHLIESPEARAQMAQRKPELADIMAMFRLTRPTGRIRQVQKSRHSVETRQFREFLASAQPATVVSREVLKLASSGKRQAVA